MAQYDQPVPDHLSIAKQMSNLEYSKFLDNNGDIHCNLETMTPVDTGDAFNDSARWIFDFLRSFDFVPLYIDNETYESLVIYIGVSPVFEDIGEETSIPFYKVKILDDEKSVEKA